MKKKKLTVIAVSAAAVLAAGVCLWVGLRYLTDNRMPNFSKEYVLYVYPDMSAETALDSIAAGAGVIRPGSMDRCAGKEDLGGRICPGRYEIDPSMTSIYVVRMLCNGWQSPQKLTLSGTIRSKGKLASVIDRQMMVDSVTVDSLLNSNEFLQQFGFDSTNVFALFLPDTYYMYWTATPDEIFSSENAAFCTIEVLSGHGTLVAPNATTPESATLTPKASAVTSSESGFSKDISDKVVTRSL